MAKLCSAPSVLSFGEPAWRSCPSADKPMLGVERTGVAEPDHTLYLKLPLECDIDHTCSDSVGQGKLHGCGRHQWSRNVSLGNFGNRIYSRYLWEIIHFVIILVTNNSFHHTENTRVYNYTATTFHFPVHERSLPSMGEIHSPSPQKRVIQTYHMLYSLGLSQYSYTWTQV